MKLFLAVIATCGHVAVGTITLNRLHAKAWPIWLLKLIDAAWVLWHALIPLVWLVWVYDPTRKMDVWPWLWWLMIVHLTACVVAALSLIPGWIHRALTKQISPLQLHNSTTVVDMIQAVGHRPAGSAMTRMLSYFPKNEIFQLHVNEKKLLVRHLAPELDGITITHFSDLHFTGAVSESFHHEVVRQVNALESDLIAVTGDLIDKARCMSWLGNVLGQLRAPLGVYFVLGNHDVRVRDELGIRRELTSRGLIDLGRRWVQLDVRGQQVILAGNELPWFAPAADLSRCPASQVPHAPLRVLLSHSPDQIEWARSHRIDLMLAGHTHGGQIQLPILGPIFSPSRYGVRYASGTFYLPPTLMHVSRGVSGTRQLRLNAPPEITRLVLVPPSTSSPV